MQEQEENTIEKWGGGLMNEEKKKKIQNIKDP